MEEAPRAPETPRVTAWDSIARAAPGAPVCSIVIPTYNGRALLERCLAAIERHRPVDPRMAIEVVVADDASTDGTAEWLAERNPWARVVRLERNGGFCAAANAGIAAARAPFIQLLNNDAEPTAGWVEAGLAPFAQAAVGSVAPLVLVRDDPARVDSAGDAYTFFGWPTKRGHGEPAQRWADRTPDEAFGASGSSAFYRSAALEKVGGYDALLGAYYEDVDLAFRLRWAGYVCVFTPRSVVLHEVSATYDHRRPALERALSRNAEIVFWSNMPPAMLALGLSPRLAFLAAQWVWRLVRGRGGPFLKGKLDALRLASAVRDRRRLRRGLARSAPRAPRFALGLGSVIDLANHLGRPRSSPRA